MRFLHFLTGLEDLQKVCQKGKQMMNLRECDFYNPKDTSDILRKFIKKETPDYTRPPFLVNPNLIFSKLFPKTLKQREG